MLVKEDRERCTCGRSFAVFALWTDTKACPLEDVFGANSLVIDAASD
jgi:hypothetical protein